MLNLQTLTQQGNYRIEGKRGEWHFSGESRDRLRFWRWAMGQANRRVSLSLSKEQAQRRVWKEVQALDLSNLEAFRGE
jgi:hypothetical protein